MFAHEGINEPHYHEKLHEVYLVAKGCSTIVVEPGELHTFIDSTPDYFHLVLHCPAIGGDKVLSS